MPAVLPTLEAVDFRRVPEALRPVAFAPPAIVEAPVVARAAEVDTLAPGESTTCPLLPTQTHTVAVDDVAAGSVGTGASQPSTQKTLLFLSAPWEPGVCTVSFRW